MRIIIFSDSHGTSRGMDGLITSLRPDMVLHLGDGVNDLSRVPNLPPETAIRTVRGNNDFASKAPDQLVLPLPGHRAFMTHGHLYNARNGYSALLQKAKNEEADILFFGHTHEPANLMQEGILLFNPGCFTDKSPRGGFYEIMDIDQDGKINASIKNIREDN